MLELKKLVDSIVPENLQTIERKESRGTGDRGIYFLFDEKELIYIGKSLAGVEGRLSTHNIPHTRYSTILLPDKTDEEISVMEVALIQKYKPKESNFI
jgi:hypothetical protein